MCGRFTLTLDAGAVQLLLGLGKMPADWTPRFNVAPSQPVAVVVDGVRRDVSWMRWGLVPFWADSISIGNRMINARSETVHEKASFRNAFRRRRCLILADGFYEWRKGKTGGGPSQPFLFRHPDGRPMTFAGLWEQWDKGDEPLQSCTIITCEANDVVRPVHDRMPVILGPDTRWEWLGLSDPAGLRLMLAPHSAGELAVYPVSRMVNDPGLDDPSLIRPVSL